MVELRFKVTSCLVTGLVCGLSLLAQVDPKAAIQQSLVAQYPLTTPTADLSDIVTAGSVVTLRKPGLVMFAAGYGVPGPNAYKGGKISQPFGANFSAGMKLGRRAPGTNTANVPKRTFVPGEKFWVTAVTVEDDGVMVQVFSDPYGDSRYLGEVKFPYQKNSPPPPNQILNTVAEVFGVEGGGREAPAQPAVEAAAPPRAPDPPMAPIAPPPPPPDAAPPPTKTISVGQTKEEVAATFGPPQKIVKLGVKEIHYYPDMKVTFVSGKVSNVE